MGFFDSIASVFNPSNWSGSGGNSLLDLMDPGNTFHTGASQRAADRQFSLEQKIAQENLDLQKEQYEYQKSLNDLQMEREDNATQRRVADLKASGLSPTLAAGSAASAAPMHAGTAPQRSIPSDVKVQAAMFKESLMKDRMQLATSLMGNIADISKTRAEVELLKAQTNQMTAWTPIDLKLKEQLYEFNQDYNPYRLQDMIAKIENTKGDTFYKERQSFLVDSQKLLNEDQHGLNALIYAGKILDNRLTSAKIDYQNQEYVKNAIAIELLRSQYQEYNYSRDFYNKKWGVPVGFNLSPWTSFFGYKEHEPGNPFGTPAPDKFNPWDKTPGSWNSSVSDFVSRTLYKAHSFIKSLGLGSLLTRITGGAFDYSK